MKRIAFYRTILWAGVFIMVVTLLVSSCIRLARVTHSLNYGEIPAVGTIDIGYVQNPVLTFLHILPGCFFMLSGAWQFIRPIRNRLIHVHRWNGRIYIVLGLVIGITGIAMGIKLSFGGMAEASASIVFGLFFLYALLKAYWCIRRKQFTLHREWMIRAYSIGLAVATIRPLTGLFFSFTAIPFHTFFGISFWIAFILNVGIAEIWIRYTRSGSGKKMKSLS
ncbi:DUF2306 domain-containing protein [Chryseobacterium echinoideorum]|uniref:DUF2306 domain-containing protein n=1 Tax=Chryseobacterium echinoideorum TaxID=1549648 RepID=UPI001186ADF5|nr:DUF2306 domain-containing protein [Chryseobacterium echinoideorum]